MANKCPACGSEAFVDAVDGLCLKCLGRFAFLSELNGPESGSLMRLGDYELLEEIARGGMGVVYRARQLSLNRIVALKVVLHGPFSSADFVRRFKHEAKIVASLRHPNIVAVHEVGEQNGHHFLSLEFVEGRSFARLSAERPLPARRAAAYLKTVAEAVHHAHERGVLHRDLKPSNILLDVFDQPRVTDFGLAKLVNSDAELTSTGEVMGSPNYMPPEQAAGKFSDCTAQSDVYSLGAILYELLTGRPPFQGDTIQSILAQTQDTEPVAPRRLNPGTPVDLQTICLKCLQKDPARRYQTAKALADDLGHFIGGEPIHARPVAWPERVWLWCRRRPRMAAMIAALVGAVVLGTAGITWQWRQAEAERAIAQKDAAETRLNLYAADIAVASQAIQNGNIGLARRILERLRPRQGEADLRGFEWRYLLNLCRGQELAVLKGHEGIVTCADFSPDGTRLASGSHDGTVRIWDTAKHELLTTLPISSGAIWNVAFTPNGRYLMTAGIDRVEFRDTATWQVWTNFPGQVAALSKTGDLLATADSNPFFWEPPGAVKIWNWHTGQLLRQIDQPGRAPALSPDGRLLAIAGTNDVISVWDTGSGKLLHEFPASHSVWSMNFSPDGRKLLSADWSSDVSLWNLDTPNAPPQMLSGNLLHVWSAVFSDDGATIATTSGDQTVRLWDTATLKQKSVLRGHSSEVWCAAFSRDGKMLATGGKDQTVMIWPGTPARPQNEFPHDMDFRPIFSPDGKRLVTIRPGYGSMLWDADTHTLITEKMGQGKQILGFSSDGKCLATFDTENTKLQFWLPDAARPEKEIPLESLTPNTNSFAFGAISPEQKFLFAIDAAGLIRVWDTATGRLLQKMQGPTPPIRNAVLAPMGTHIAVCIENENIARLYDCATGAEMKLAGHRDFVSGLAFSPDGATLATGSMDGTIRLWNTATGQSISTLPGHMQETTDVAFSPDGRTLASLGHNESFKLWHLPTLREVVSENDPHAGLWVLFSPDGSNLAVETDTNKVELLSGPAE